jgi:16S rRNA processing protein RimM
LLKKKHQPQIAQKLLILLLKKNLINKSPNMNDRSEDRKIPLGIFGKPFGVKGYIFLKYYGDNQENIKDFDELYIDEWHCLEIDEVLISNKKLSIKLKGIEDRNNAESLRNKEVYVLESNLPPLGEGEYYWFQLENLKVINEQNEFLGIIDHVMPTGANDVLVVKPLEGSVDNDERLIPFLKKEIITKVELLKKTVYVKWPKDF